MSSWGRIPPEPPAIDSLDGLAPQFRAKVETVLDGLRARGWAGACLLESRRTDERQIWLYGFGRSYDDDRGIVTNVASALTGWHFYGLAVDFGLKSRNGAPAKFFADVFELVEQVGLTSGADWNHNGVPDAQEPGKHFCDGPHAQWWVEGMHVNPSANAIALYESGGLPAVWAALEAA